MASVFLALDLSLDRKVAIKVMSPALLSSGDALERFRREARVAASLSHPNIIPVYAVGDDPELAYFVMKYVEGRSLDSVIREGGLQSVPFVQTIISYAGGALNYAHHRGVVHRDVKPANFMLDLDGWLVVTDFGIAKLDDGHGLTMSGTLIGTPYYMSPEQFNGLPIGGASDQYALGVVAFELLTGRTPFNGGTIAEVMRGHLIDDVPSVRTLRSDVPVALDACIMRMLAKEASARFPTLAEAVTAFGAVSPKAEAAVRTHIISLARSGAAQQPRMSVPVSPIPAPRKSASVAERTQARYPASGSISIVEAAPRRPSGSASRGQVRVTSAPLSRTRALRFGLLASMLVVAVAVAVVRPDLIGLRARSERTVSDAPSAPRASTNPAVVPTGPDTAKPPPVGGSVAPALAAAPPPVVVPTRDSSRRVPAVGEPTARQFTVRAPSIAAPAGKTSPAATDPYKDKLAKLAVGSVVSEVGAGVPAAKLPDVRAESTVSPAPAPAAVRESALASVPVPPPVPTGPGHIKIGSGMPLTILYVNGGGYYVLTTPRSIEVPSGPVRLRVVSEPCKVEWDTAFTVTPGVTHIMGLRPRSCPAQSSPPTAP